MLISPAFLLFRNFRIDYSSLYYMPLRLGVLVRYGEGPHMSALALLPFSLAAGWQGLRRGHPAQLAASALFAALAVANNFYGATALAHFFPVLAWSVWLAERDRMVWLRAAAVAALAIALDAFWLTPSYIRITLENMKWVSSPGHAWSAALLVLVVAVYVALSLRLARGRPERAWPVFCLGSLAIFGLMVMGNQYFDFRVIGEPGRLIPELELAIFLAAGLLFAWMARRGRWWKAAAIGLALAYLAPAKGYVRHAWQTIPGRSTHRNRVEFIVSDWVHKNLPGVRTLATGSVRFWYNAWYDLPQLGGGSEQGLLNVNTQWAQANAVANDDAAVSIAWLQAMGTGAVYVDDKNSTEIYHDWSKSEKFEGKLEKLYDDRTGNRIYRVPRRYDPLARVVDAARIHAIAPNSPQTDYAALHRYVDAIERGPAAPLNLHRIGTDGIRIRTQIESGQRLLVQETYDPAWRAYSVGRPVPISRDPMGFLLLDPGSGDHDILLRFETPFENRAGMVVSLMAAAAVLWMTVGQLRVARS
jgi:hypothetical protein